MAALIEPRILKGFRDFLPQAETVRRNLAEKIEASLRSFGFVPIDTPALEYADILLGKGGGETEKQIYRFTDNGGRDVALRFDLTVPFARFAAQYKQELVFPFKRYHIGKVWRGENTQRGRYREFTQCDFDIIGSDGAAADFEIILMIKNTLADLGLSVNIKINHRGLFNRFLSHIGQSEKSVEILRAVDKLAKIGLDETTKTLSAITGEANGQKILEYINAGTGRPERPVSFEKTLDRITELSGGPSPESERLSLLHKFMKDVVKEELTTEEGKVSLPRPPCNSKLSNGQQSSVVKNSSSFSLDPSITRGLDYYTGVVFETFLTELPDIGSICSGGRYDNLAGLYSKDRISGVGSSIGLDRMIAALESLDKLPPANGFAAVAVCCVKQEDAGLYQALAARFRQKGVPCEVFTDGDGKNLVKQFVLAEKKGHKWAVIPGEDPLRGPLTLRDLVTRQNLEGLSVEEVINIISR